jgi:signal transduction histidine kinase
MRRADNSGEDEGVRDIADDLARQLEHQRAAHEQFVTILAHELRNAVTPLAGLARTLLDRYDTIDDPTRIELVGRVSRQATWFGVLIEELLSFARFDASVYELLDVAAVVQLACASASVEVRTVETDYEPGTSVYVTERDLLVILRNLLRNAEAHGRPPTVVRAVRRDEITEVRVIDHGDGVRPAFVDSLFTPFCRDRPQTDVRGVGLGLWIARQLVERNGGSIRYEGDDFGGACFVVELPTASPA